MQIINFELSVEYTDEINEPMALESVLLGGEDILPDLGTEIIELLLERIKIKNKSEEDRLIELKAAQQYEEDHNPWDY